MPNQATSLPSITAAIAAAALSLSIQSLARADQQTQETPAVAVKKHAAKTHPKQKQTANARKIYGAAPSSGRCAWPYRNMFPPCMSTWPEDDPNFHGGTHPGVTFDDPWEPWWK
jgi:hypothetical protein